MTFQESAGREYGALGLQDRAEGRRGGAGACGHGRRGRWGDLLRRGRAVLLRVDVWMAVMIACWAVAPARGAVLPTGSAHVWETQEIILQAERDYANPYADVECWIELSGPEFSRKVYGFWDGGRTFRIRFVATAAGEWTWKTGSNQAADKGLNNGQGKFKAVAWTDAEKGENANRRGFVRATPNGHALQYADGAPFFLVGDTWLAGSTRRLPWKGVTPAPNYVPASGIGFEEAVAYRKGQGFNSVSMIASFPNWAADSHGATFANKDGVYLRNAWEKFGTWAPNATVTTADGATTTAKDMHDEQGNRPFEVFADREGLADFDHINPAYFRSLDRKMRYLSEQGFVPFLETVRRDNAPSWKKYFDFNTSYGRYVEYLIARYGAFNLIFSGIHLDWIPANYSLTADEFNAALTQHYKTYGPLPFGQPYTTLIDSSTYKTFGHGDKAPWLTMHTVGNKPRNNAIYASLEEIFRLQPAYPAANMEPYYTGWSHANNRPAGEAPAENSDRDVYFSRSMMYGSVLSGALAGHVHGTGAYDITTTGENPGWRPYIWDALRFTSGGQMQYMQKFVMSEGARYQELQLASDQLKPRATPEALADGLDGWGFMMRTPDLGLALLYFELKAVRPQVTGFKAGARYRWTWYDPREGKWGEAIVLTADGSGTLAGPAFPGDAGAGGAGGTAGGATHDWAAKIMPMP